MLFPVTRHHSISSLPSRCYPLWSLIYHDFYTWLFACDFCCAIFQPIFQQQPTNKQPTNNSPCWSCNDTPPKSMNMTSYWCDRSGSGVRRGARQNFWRMPLLRVAGSWAPRTTLGFWRVLGGWRISIFLFPTFFQRMMLVLKQCWRKDKTWSFTWSTNPSLLLPLPSLVINVPEEVKIQQRASALLRVRTRPGLTHDLEREEIISGG